MDEVRHPEAYCHRQQTGASLLCSRPRAQPFELLAKIFAAAAVQLLFLRRVQPQHDPPAAQDREQITRQIGEKPLAVENTYVAGLFDDSTGENRRRSRDEHLVEDS